MQCVQAETAAKKAMQTLTTPQNQPTSTTSTTSTKDDVGGNHSIFCSVVSSNKLVVAIIPVVAFLPQNSDVRVSHKLCM
jgi:hypothetical protein